MRRRRHLLQVSTFPFLAVLLCTMGSLLMLLLVIDRRAKIAARNKAVAELAKSMEDQDKSKADHIAELKKRREAAIAERDAERQELERQHSDLTDQVRVELTKLGSMAGK